jgi:MYXO-CTERM domain-containing protein
MQHRWTTAREGRERDGGSPGAFARVAALAAALVMAACGQGTSAPTHDESEHTGEVSSAAFVNGGFETGPANQPPPSWTVLTNLNNGITIQTPQTKAGLNLQAGGTALTTILSTNAGVESQTDPGLGAGASFRWPKFGKAVAIVNGQGIAYNQPNGGPQYGKNVNTLTQTMTVDNTDVDPADGQIHVRATLAPVLQNPNHTNEQQPYFFVQLTNVTTNTILYQDFNFSGQAGVAWKSVVNGGNTINYTDWTLIDIPGGAGIKIGDQVKLEVIASSCSLGGHYGQVYVDSVGTQVPGLYVFATAPKASNADTDITYTLNYKNGSPTNAAGVKIDFTTPPNTTFVSLNAPGLTCTNPQNGGTGLVSCTVGALNAGATGTYTITVHIVPGATGTIVQGNYDIYATGVSPLYGSKVTTIIGCLIDSDCSAGNWCHISPTAACLPTLPNGTPMPSDAAHANPTLNGTCSAAAGALVCTSGVCDGADNKCGYANGDGTCTAQNAAKVCRSGVCGSDGKCGFPNAEGPCTAQNGATLCRSGVCDPDLKCGLANGDGPCTAQNQAVICRSQSCSVNGFCQPAGGCNVDADCSADNWCNEAQHVCTSKLANGSPIPSDPPHANPTLNGTCTGPAATLTCQSAVCDGADNKCGYANGDGPCTAANGGTVCRSGVCDPDLKCGYAVNDGPCTKANASVVCRSGACSANGLCEPAGGCNVDADCSNGNWCLESTHTCTPKLANGSPVPNDPPHSNPTLNAKCTAAAGTLVCVSGVCDTKDNLCGYADLDGPCTLANGPTVCRSKACSVNGTCLPVGGCNVDGDCAEGNFCFEQTHTCTPRLANGQPIPNDPPHSNPTLNAVCTQAAGALVCQALVCDVNDNKCGYANGDGPCTKQNQATVCRSGACSVDGTCMPVGGCNADGDCQPGNWCMEQTHTCTPQLNNGVSVPKDPPHKNPTLDGTCTAASGALVCKALVCDVNDNKCGYANGDGPCTKQNQATVCRSGACSVSGTCMPAGGCNADGDCAAGTWCNIQNHACGPTLDNGQPMPSDPPHKNPTLDGTCTGPAASLVCTSKVCDKDNACGYANGDGPCDTLSAAVVCRSKTCSQSGICMAPGACFVDADCAQGKWCNESTNTCTDQLPNGQPVPNDPPHQKPTLSGVCTAEAGALTCVSGVCDANDNLCGYADGDGPCTPQNAGIVCRSGACSANGTCEPAGGCNVDADCDADKWCNTGTHTCAAKLPNGQQVPSDPGHQNPTLDGTCTDAAGALTCVSGVCDAKDNLCGYADGDGPCTPQNAGAVCRSGACSANGLCEPQGGCNVDGDCAADLWCNTGTHTCTAKLPNGQPVPKDPGHASPTLDGTCTADAGALTCESGVCDVKDNLCGYADGDGPCTQNEASKCRSGKCSHNGTCEPKNGCNTDSDCDGGNWCEESTNTCKPKLANGTAMPKDPPHASPSLDGKCSDEAAQLVCASGVCDAKDDKCGLADGDGPCTDANGADICRSGVCTNGLCGGPPGCTKDAECPSQKPVCDTKSGACVECTDKNESKCTGAKPICDVATETCVPCDGDFGGDAKHACPTKDAPVCNAGSCGKCGSDADCKGHAGAICDLGSGTCVQGCHVDADCGASQWCDGVGGAAGVCHDKLDNGTHLPKAPPNVSTCSDAVGARVCKSGACDTKDDTCGLLPGDGPCDTDSQCRSSTCDVATHKCAPQLPTGCTSDAQCGANDYCKAGACTPKQPVGALCDAPNQCQSNMCESNKCDDVIASGNGLACAVQNAGSSDDDGAFAALGLAIAAAGLARRRRRR